MKYFLDTEFIEGFHKPLFGKKRHHIDLISIGMVCEDGRCYSALSNEYSYNDADDWVKDNVILPLYNEIKDVDKSIKINNFNKLLGSSNKTIALDIIKFIFDGMSKKDNVVEFYGYYSDYDWVVFCSIFGKMINLPEKFPKYCRDLKQTLDEKARRIMLPISLKNKIEKIKSYPNYPKQSNEHNALADAQWNFDLYNFLKELN